MTTSMFTEPVRCQAAWHANELESNRRWIYQLSADDIAELESALEQSKRLNLGVPALTREHFPLPNLGKRLAALLKEVEDGLGIALVRGLPIQRYTKQDAGTIFWG